MNIAFLTPGRRIERLCLSPEKLKITGFQSPAGDHEQGPLSVDPVTGDILVRKKITYSKSPDAEYESWATKRRACKHLIADHATA